MESPMDMPFSEMMKLFYLTKKVDIFDPIAARLGNRTWGGFGKAASKSTLSKSAMVNRGYRRAGIGTLGVGGLGAYGLERTFRSSGRDGLQGRSSGGY